MLTALLKKERVAMTAGFVSFAGFIVTAVLVLIDQTEVSGIGRWIKPAKFFISIAIFMWTIGVYLFFLRGWPRLSRVIVWGLSAVFVIEMVIITGQAARGVRSHFNLTTPFDAAMYAVMGVSIAISTLLTASLLYAYFRGPLDLTPDIAFAMRLGLAISLLGTVLGGYMSAQTGHTVGAPDGGPGLPFVNWSTAAGDLRVAHFLGLHGLQIVPLFAVGLKRMTRDTRVPTAVFVALYTAAVLAVFYQALAGTPLVKIS